MMRGCHGEKLNITVQIDHPQSRPRQGVLTRELQVCRHLGHHSDIVKTHVSDHVEVDDFEIVESSGIEVSLIVTRSVRSVI